MCFSRHNRSQFLGASHLPLTESCKQVILYPSCGASAYEALAMASPEVEARFSSTGSSQKELFQLLPAFGYHLLRPTVCACEQRAAPIQATYSGVRWRLALTTPMLDTEASRLDPEHIDFTPTSSRSRFRALSRFGSVCFREIRSCCGPAHGLASAIWTEMMCGEKWITVSEDMSIRA